MNDTIVFFNKILNQGLSLNEAYILWCKKYMVTPHASIDVVRCTTSLRLHGYLNKEFKVSPLGEVILNTELVDGKIKKKELSVDQLADKLREIYPRVQLYGSSARSSKTDVIKKLNDFFKYYKNEGFTSDDVVKATELYVKEYADRGYDRMKWLKYFIMKDNESLLANQITTMKEDFDEPEIDEQYKMS